MAEPDAAAEAADPDVLSPREEDELLAGAPWRRLVALGDSVVEGIREPVAGYRDLGWIERIGEALGRARPGFDLRNLGRRDLRAAEVRAAQLGPALEARPDLAVVVCGGNDMLARRFDADAVERELEAIVSRLQEAGAEVVNATLFDITRALRLPPEMGGELDARLAELHDRVRALSRRRGTLLVELAELEVSADSGIYSSDFRHVNARGHAIAASAAVRALGARLRERAGAGAERA